MSFPIEQKLVIAVSSSALFDLSASDAVFKQQGPAAYKMFQQQHLDTVLDKGVAFPFIKRFLQINQRFPNELPVEVVLLSRNSVTTGKRVFRSIQHYGLDITRAAFLEGKSPYEFIPTFNASLFLSANEEDIHNAIAAGYPAGLVLPATVNDDDEQALRIAFDFDGVIADDEAEKVYQRNRNVDEFIAHELEQVATPHNPGPLADLFKKIALLQQLEDRCIEQHRDYQRIIHTSIVTARNAPAHERVVTTLENWGVSPNSTFFLGGMAKQRILSTLKPHIFFDDQRGHLESAADNIAMVHIPFGIANQQAKN